MNGVLSRHEYESSLHLHDPCTYHPFLLLPYYSVRQSLQDTHLYIFSDWRYVWSYGSHRYCYLMHILWLVHSLLSIFSVGVWVVKVDGR